MAVTAETVAVRRNAPPVIHHYECPPLDDSVRERAEEKLLMGFQILSEMGVWEELSAAKEKYQLNGGWVQPTYLIYPQNDVRVALGETEEDTAFVQERPPGVLSGYSLVWTGKASDCDSLGPQSLYEQGICIIDGKFLTQYYSNRDDSLLNPPETFYKALSNPGLGNSFNINVISGRIPRRPILDGTTPLPGRENYYPEIRKWIKGITERRFSKNLQGNGISLIHGASVVNEVFPGRKVA